MTAIGSSTRVRMKPLLVAAIVLLAVACVSGSTVGTSGVADSDETSANSAADTSPTIGGDLDDSQAVFSEPTSVVVVFDDGIDGVLSVDLDNRVGARRVVDGQRAGDALHRLVRVGDSLVVGWGSIHALLIDTLEAQPLGEATVFIPAEEPQSVWLVDYPGGRIGQGTPTYQQVGLDGTESTSAPGLDPSEALASHGISGGIVHEADRGIVLWEAESQEVVRVPGTGPGFVADVYGRLVAWCDGECVLHLTDVDGADTVVQSPDESRPFEPRSARFSPDGRLLAAIVGDSGPIDPDSRAAIAMVEVDSGDAALITEPLLPRPSYLAWSDDGQNLLFSSWSYQQPETLLGWYRPADGHLEVAILPFGGALSFVVLEQDDAGAFLPAELGPRENCGQVGSYPSGRTGICGFRF